MVSKTDNDVKEGELKLAGFIVQHDLPMSIADHLSKLMKIECKVTGMLTNVTGKESREQLLRLLRKHKFSLIVDESTDKDCVKHLCIVESH